MPPCTDVTGTFYNGTAGPESHANSSLTFVVQTAEAAALYRGCRRKPQDARELLSVRLPDMLVVGVQKGGTTSFEQDAQPASCFALGEMHFFDREEFARHPISVSDLMGYAQQLKKKQTETPRTCRNLVVPTAPGSLPLVEKSPSYYYSPHAALRMCEALAEPRILLMLREPVQRAYSGYYQVNVLNADAGFTNNPAGFHKAVTVDMAIVRGCSDTVEPDGDPAVDALRSAAFAKCCRGVVRSQFNLSYWEGCACTHTTHYSPWARYCQYGGDKRAAHVRMGLYVWALRRLYRYHRPSNVLLVRSEDFFAHSIEVSLAAFAFARPSAAANLPPPVDVHVNSAVAGHLPMYKDTEAKLRDFYAPYNAALEKLVGRRLWSFD